MANITPENLSAELEAQSNQSTDLLINDTANKIGDLVGSQAVGSADLIGIGWLLVAGFMLWKADVRIDVAAAVFIPTTMFLAEYGFMPYSAGVVDGLLIGVAAVFGIGVARMLFR